MKLILLRHGKTEATEKHLYCGSTDIGLSASGIAGLRQGKAEIAYPNIAGLRVITSGMRRCEETLAELYGDAVHEVLSDFREIDFGVFEMHSYEELRNDAAYLQWISGDNQNQVPPGGESGAMMEKRVLAALDRVVSEGRDTLILSHGGVIAAVMEHLFPGEGKNRYAWQPKPGRGYEITISDQRYTVI